MKASDLESALSIRKKLEDAKVRHRQVSAWQFGSPPYFIDIERASVQLNFNGAWTRVRDALLSAIQEEIEVYTQEITQLGVTLE